MNRDAPTSLDARIVIDRPRDDGGIWFGEVHANGRVVAVQWQVDRGFGLSRTIDDGYGLGPEEVYHDLSGFLDRLMVVLGIEQARPRHGAPPMNTAPQPKPCVPFTMFGQTRLVPLRIYHGGRYLDDPAPEWDGTFWVERGEDLYGLDGQPTKRLLIVEREDWLKSPHAATEHRP